MTYPVFALSGAVLMLVGLVAVLIPSHITFAWPQSAASWILVHKLCQYLLALLGLGPSCTKGIASAWARVLVVSQQHFPLGHLCSDNSDTNNVDIILITG